MVAKTEPAPERVAAKRTPQVDFAAPKVVQIVQTGLSLDMSEVHPFIRARAKMLTDVIFSISCCEVETHILNNIQKVSTMIHWMAPCVKL